MKNTTLKIIAALISTVTLLAFGATFSVADTGKKVYKTVDGDGKVTFSDQPSTQASEVEINVPNSSAPVEPRPTPASTSDSETGYQQVTIISPKSETLIPNGLVPFTVTASVNPALKVGHRLQLSINNTVHSSNLSGNFQIESIPRGTHSLRVDVVDANGASLKTSAPITLYARRPGG